MTAHKLLLDDDFSEEFSLLAIHCSEEAYKIAYLLNQRAGLRLCRRETDLEFTSMNLNGTFPLFEFNDEMQYTTYNLVANKCMTKIKKGNKEMGLFSEDTSETITSYLIPEQKQVDYFLKIFSDFEMIPLRKIVSDLNEIKQVISAYTLDVEELKSKNNLIFD